MENTSEKKDKNSVKKPLKHICIGLVAHVDAGKTTLSEGMLYLSGQIRNMGRVDHGDTFLDNYETERERGITIFSKQAEFIWNDTSITILDTPGHVDFSAEMERVLQVLDCAVLVVSAVDGVQAHTVTLWRLLKQYKIPTMIFVNKMDRQEADREKLLEELKNRFGDGCVEMDMQSEENSVNADRFLSVHINSADSASAKGTETLYKDYKTYASVIHSSSLSGMGYTKGSSYDRSLVYRPGLAVLRGTKMMSALAEMGFISNSTESARIDARSEAIGSALYQSLCNSFN